MSRLCRLLLFMASTEGGGITGLRSIRVLGLALLLLAAAALSKAQDKAQPQPKDAMIVTVGFIAHEYTELFDTKYRPGLVATFNAKISGEKTRLGGKFRFDKLDASERYTFGPELSHKLGFEEPYAHFLIGFETVINSDDKEIVRTFGGGVRLNFRHVVLNPFQFDSTRKGGFGSQSTNQVGSSVGIRF